MLRNNPNSAVIGMAAGTVDVVSESRRQETLLRAGALQSAIFNSANFSSIATDAKGVIQIFNVGAERMLGYTAAEVMNKITPADISDPQEVIARAKALSVELGTPITPGFEALVFKASRGMEDIYELTYIRKDGSRFPAVVSVTALRDAQGTIIGYLLIGTDNTARKQVEEEQKKLDQRLRDQQFYTRSLIESNIDAIMTTDPSGIISDVNKQMEALTGCTRDELIGAPFKNYFTDPERAAAAIELVLREKKVTDYELTARSREGKETVVSYNATTFYDRDRTLQGVFAAARDVTERKRLDRALEEAKEAAEASNRAKSVFLSTMSHEIRTPMNGVLGMLELLSLSKLDAAQRVTLDVVRESGTSLQRIIDDILDFSKIEAGKLEVRPEAASITATLEAVRNIYSENASSKGVPLKCSIDPRISPALLVDPMRLRQILNNLVSNALKFTDRGFIEIKAELMERAGGEDRVRFSVKDTGIGISPDNQAHLFQPFVQAGDKTAPHFGGTGLGLTICQRLARMMGGSIAMASELGIGTTMIFELSLPIVDPQALAKTDSVTSGDWLSASGKTRREAPDIAQAQSEGTLVLLADDHPTNRSLLLRQVNTLGYAAESAENGIEALSKWKSGRFGILITDCNMPEMNGYELTRSIRELESASGGKRVPIIACTAIALEGEAEACLDAGMDDYLAKPVALKELAKKLDRWLPLVQAAAPLDREVLSAICGGDAAAERDILTDFRRANDADAAMFKLALDARDAQRITLASHRIRGASSAIGAIALAAVCERLERAGRAGDWQAIEVDIGAFQFERERLNSCCEEAGCASPN
jgi:PAS domain S-box-containing protein